MVSGKKVIAGIAGAVAVGGAVYGVYTMSKRHTTSQSDSKADTTASTGTDTGDGTDTSSSGVDSTTGTSNLSKKTVVEEIPITTYEEALDFAKREWNKIKRDNGRTLECQTIGSANWITGEWCKVYLPSFDIDGYMYIIRTSQTSEGGDWSCNLSLVDYPPGWGKEDLKAEAEENDEENSDEDDGDDDGSEEDAS